MSRSNRLSFLTRWRSAIALTMGLLVVTSALAATSGLPSAVLNAIPTARRAVLGDHYPTVSVKFPDGVSGYPGLTYAVIPGYRPLHLDLYLPPGPSKPHPLIVYIHGGGWAFGQPRQSGAFVNWPDVLALIASQGFTVASVEYRLSSEAPFPAAIQDVKAAVRWLRAHAGRYEINPREVGVWGGSAGGHLAALAAVTCGVRALSPTVSGGPQVAPGIGQAKIAPAGPQRSCVQAFASWYGVFRFRRRPRIPSLVRLFLGCAHSACTRQQVDAANPWTYVKSGEPPGLLIVGSADTVVGAKQSKDFYRLLRAHGDPVQLLIIPGVNHSFIGKTPEATRAASLEALQRTIEFFESTLSVDSTH